MGRAIAAAVFVAAVALALWVIVRGDDSSVVLTDPAETFADESAEAPAAEPETAAAEPAAEPAVPAAEPAAAEPPEALENLGPRMDLVDIDGWLNTDASSIDDFDGKVLLVEMWTFGCSNCKARIPYNQGYYDEFAGSDFEIIGVHAPEFGYEAELANIVDAVDRLGVTWPVALDTSKTNFRDWQPGRTNYWPRTYVIDQTGEIRYDHIGEGRYDELREVIRWLIDNPPATAAQP